MLVGTVMIYAALFATGFFIYGNMNYGTIATIVALTGGFIIIKSWKNLR